MSEPLLYLSGPISAEHAAHCLAWRHEVRLLLPAWQILDPCRGREHDLRRTSYTPNELRCRDLTDIKASRVVLCHPDIPDLAYLGIGTWGECMIAGLVWHKPVVLVTEREDVREHPWVRSAVVRNFTELAAACKYIEEVWG